MAFPFNIQVSLEVFKTLTAKLEDGQSHDDVIRELLELDSIAEPETPNALEQLGYVADEIVRGIGGSAGGFHSRGLWLPNDTVLRARYKQRVFVARIDNGRWLDQDGAEHRSPSAAASAITSTNVNGLRFWQARRPTDSGWRRLEAFVANNR